MTTYDDRASLTDLTSTVERVRSSVEGVIEGKPEVVRLSLTVLLAEGHLLIEDVPGVGKTMLAKALARSIDCSVRRIQFTPDLLPSDITGVSIWDQQRQDFEFKPGAIFAQIVIGDEINRASPKTQSALLESMEERQVTIDGTTYELPSPFMVVATQNPVEMEGTYPLPEAQRDRFMARVSVGYPSAEAELQMLDVHGGVSPLEDLQPVAHAHEIVKLIEAVRGVHVAETVRRYAVDLVAATRTPPGPQTRRLPARDAASAARGEGVRRPERPGVRAAGRHPGARRGRPGPPAAAHRPGPAQPPYAGAGRAGDPPAHARCPRRPRRRAASARAAATPAYPQQPPRRLDDHRRAGSAEADRGGQGRAAHRPGRSHHTRALLPGRRHRGRRSARTSSGRATCCGSGLLLAVLPLVCATVLYRTRYRVAGSRRLSPARVPAGSEARVHLRMDNVSRLPTGPADAPGPGAVRARPAPAVRAGPGGGGRPPRGVLPRPLRPARPLSAGPAPAAPDRPVRHVRADPVLLDVRHPDGHPARGARCRRCG